MPFKQRVLIVEDDLHVLNMLRRMTTFADLPTTTAQTYQHAQACLNAQTFDVVLLDLHLEDGNGADLMPLIHSRSPQAGIVLITAQTDQRIIRKLLHSGADHHFQKPLKVTDVMHYLEHMPH